MMADVSMQVELHGGSQRHPDTQQFHTGISYIRATGTPVYNFELVSRADASHNEAMASSILNDPNDTCEQHACPDLDIASSSTIATTSVNQSPADVLRYIKYDNLVQAGGLHANSERGRLLRKKRISTMSYDNFLHFEDFDEFNRYPSEDERVLY